MAVTPSTVLDDPQILSDDVIGRSATRKATLHLIPLIALGYGVAYMDRANISFAALQMNRDIHFSATVYGLGAGLFFLSYAACEIPSNLLLYRFGARRWLARIMITWGILAMGMLFVRTPFQFYTARLLLGMSEAGFFPGVIFYLMQWFPPELRARTVSRFYISLPLSSVFMGLIAGSLLNLDGHLGLHGWQWLFLIEGLPAVLLGITFYFLLPDNPSTAKWLTEPERQWIIEHVDKAPSSATHRGDSIVRALLDPRVWQLGIFMFVMIASSYAYTFIAPDIVQRSTHLSTTNVGFIIAGLSLIGALGMLLNAMHSDRTQERYWHIIPWCLLFSLGFVLCGTSTKPFIAVPALGLLILAYNSMQGPVWSLPANFLRGRSAAAGIAAINMIAITGGFLGPYFIGLAKDLTGDYQRGLSLMGLPMLIGTGIMLYLRRDAQRRPLT